MTPRRLVPRLLVAAVLVPGRVLLALPVLVPVLLSLARLWQRWRSARADPWSLPAAMTCRSGYSELFPACCKIFEGTNQIQRLVISCGLVL